MISTQTIDELTQCARAEEAQAMDCTDGDIGMVISGRKHEYQEHMRQAREFRHCIAFLKQYNEPQKVGV